MLIRRRTECALAHSGSETPGEVGKAWVSVVFKDVDTSGLHDWLLCMLQVPPV